MRHPVEGSQRVEHAGRPCQATRSWIAGGHLHVAVETHHEVFHFVLKSLHDGRGQNHQGDPERHAGRGDANHRPRIQCAVAARHALGQGSFHVHSLKGKGSRGWCA